MASHVSSLENWFFLWMLKLRFPSFCVCVCVCSNRYDYMGACDLTFVDAPKFAENMPMKINIRTKTRYDYSFIESAVLNIGEETFEVASWAQYFLNGVEGALLPNTIAGFEIKHTKASEKVHEFEVLVGEDEKIVFKTFKDWVSVTLIHPNVHRYTGSAGLMGHTGNGRLYGRDGQTLFTDYNAFAEEWQVHEDEPMLFQTARMPQHPQKCVMPDATKTGRRLGESIAYETAAKACAGAGWSKGTIEMCIHDVMASGDLEIAEAGAM